MRCLPTGAATFVVGVVAVVDVVGGGGVVSLFAERAHNVRRPTRTASRTTLRVGRIVLDKTARPDSRTRRIVFFFVCARVCSASRPFLAAVDEILVFCLCFCLSIHIQRSAMESRKTPSSIDNGRRYASE